MQTPQAQRSRTSPTLAATSPTTTQHSPKLLRDKTSETEMLLWKQRQKQQLLIWLLSGYSLNLWDNHQTVAAKTNHSITPDRAGHQPSQYYCQQRFGTTATLLRAGWLSILVQRFLAKDMAKSPLATVAGNRFRLGWRFMTTGTQPGTLLSMRRTFTLAENGRKTQNPGVSTIREAEKTSPDLSLVSHICQKLTKYR